MPSLRLSVHQFADIAKNQLQVAVAAEPLVNRLRRAIDRKHHKIESRFHVGVCVEPPTDRLVESAVPIRYVFARRMSFGVARLSNGSP